MSDIEARRAISFLQERVSVLEAQVQSLQMAAPRGIPQAKKPNDCTIAECKEERRAFALYCPKHIPVGDISTQNGGPADG